MHKEKNLGIDFYSGFRKKNSRGGGVGLTFIVASGKPLKGGAILIPKKVPPPPPPRNTDI